jgi:hypothetical protein
MNGMNYAGLDIHKKSISCWVRQADGTIVQEARSRRPVHGELQNSAECRRS